MYFFNKVFVGYFFVMCLDYNHKHVYVRRCYWLFEGFVNFRETIPFVVVFKKKSLIYNIILLNEKL